VNQIDFNFLELLQLLAISISVKSVFPEWAVVIVCLIFALAVNIFKKVSTEFLFFVLSLGGFVLKLAL